jgi:hypothetical protein
LCKIKSHPPQLTRESFRPRGGGGGGNLWKLHENLETQEQARSENHSYRKNRKPTHHNSRAKVSAPVVVVVVVGIPGTKTQNTKHKLSKTQEKARGSDPHGPEKHTKPSTTIYARESSAPVVVAVVGIRGEEGVRQVATVEIKGPSECAAQASLNPPTRKYRTT